MGKIAYGRRRTEKKTGTRNETYVVEQSDFPVYERIHEAIIAEEDWELAQEKRSKNNYRREKIHDPEHAHILSGILKCPCCGKGMYGNIAKAGRKDNKTRYLEKQLSVLNASLHQAETITELKSQIYELKKNQIDADSIYGFLGAFNEVYSECTDAEKKQFMQAFIERIDIFPERRKDGNWIQDIKFQFPVPIIKEGKEVVQIKGISLDKEKSDEHMISLEKLSTLGTVVLLFQLKQKPDDYINVTIELDDVDITSAETKATYDEIKKPIGILQGKSLPKILRQNKYVMNQVLTKRKNS